MPGFRRSTWFALGLIMGSLTGSGLGLLLASEAGDILRNPFQPKVKTGVERVRGAAARLTRRDEPRAEPSHEDLETERVPQEASDAT
jgi:hypothetical protein